VSRVAYQGPAPHNLDEMTPQERPVPRSTMRHSEAADRGATPKPPVADIDFNLTPFTVAWEITRACALRCVHCRAATRVS
jgi:hypothetical protein